MESDTSPKQMRGPGLVRHVLQITLLEIAEAGLDRLTIERVATRSGVNKTTLYRRWPTPQRLAEAALDLVADAAPPPDTGSLREDLVLYLLRLHGASNHPLAPALLRWRLGGVPEGEAQADLQKRFARADDETLVMFQRARDRGELAQTANLQFLRDAFVGMAHYLEVAGAAEPQRIADLFLSGAMSRTPTTQDTPQG